MKKINEFTRNLTITILAICIVILFQQTTYAQWYYCSCEKTCTTTGGYAISDSKWDHNELTYYFVNGTDDITGSQEELAFEAAFDAWAEVSLLSFSEAASAVAADITIRYIYDYNEWCSLFNDTENVDIACSFYPEDNCSGMIFLNDERQVFTLSTGSAIDLYTVAIHEVGHALGLCHSSNSSAVMYGDWETWEKPRTLHDDEDGINALYPPQEITFKNNFTGGSIYVENLVTSVSAPVTRSYLENDEVAIKAVSPQTPDSYERIWHTGTTNKSEWSKKPYGFQEGPLYEYSIQFTYDIESDDDNAEIIANLRKVCDNITIRNYLPGVGYGGVIKVNGNQVSSPSSGNEVIESNPIIGEAISQTIDGIYYTLDKWNTDDETNHVTFYPDVNETYTANYDAKPIWTNRNL